MLITTEGIVLNYVKYSDNSVIVNVYTEQKGRQAYILNISKSKKSKVRTGILQPLFLIELTAYHKDSREIQRIKEIRNAPVYQSIPFDIVKSAQIVFIAEILVKTLREQTPASELFSFIKNSLLFFDLAEEASPNFHLWFLIRLNEHLGFSPNLEYAGFKGWFDMRQGKIIANEPPHPFFIHPDATAFLKLLSEIKLKELDDLKILRSTRIYLTSKLVDYYQLHFEHIGEVKSLTVLHELFS